MKYICPLCGSTLATEDLQIFTCLNCDETFTSEELEEEFGGCSFCQTDHED